MLFCFVLPFLIHYTDAKQSEIAYSSKYEHVVQNQRDSAKQGNSFFPNVEKYCDIDLLISEEKFTDPIIIPNMAYCQSVSIFKSQFNNIQIKAEQSSIIYIINADFSLEDSDFINCFSQNVEQEVICHAIYLDENTSHNSNIVRCNFTNNGDPSSDKNKGAIIFSRNSNNLRIIDSQFLTTNEISTRSIESVFGKNINLIGNTFLHMTSAVFIEKASNVEISSCTFDENRLENENPEKDYIGSSLNVNLNQTLVFTNNTIMNHAENLSCVISFNKESSQNKRSLLNSESDNSKRTVLISDTTFKNNRCTKNFEGSGIGLYVDDSNEESRESLNIEFYDCKFIGNGDKNKESAAGVFGFSSKLSCISFVNCFFESNVAHETSGLIDIKDGANLRIERCTVTKMSGNGFLKFRAVTPKNERGNEKSKILISSTFSSQKENSQTNFISIDKNDDNYQIDSLNIYDCTFDQISTDKNSFLFDVYSNSVDFQNNKVSLSPKSKNSNLFNLKNPKMERLNVNYCDLSNCQFGFLSTKASEAKFVNTVYENAGPSQHDSVVASNSEEFLCENCSFIYSGVHSSTTSYRAIYIEQSSNAVINNVTFKNCWGPGTLDGHAICSVNPNSNSNTLTISSCVFEECGNHKSVVFTENKVINFIDNKITFGSSDDGTTGLLIKKISQITVDGCTFTNCKPSTEAGHRGGGIEYEKPEDDFPNEMINIMNTEFQSCSGDACAMCLMPRYAQPTIFNVTVNNSRNSYYTIMIIIDSVTQYSQQGEVLFQNSSFLNIWNLKKECGCGVWYSTTNTENDTLSFVDCKFKDTYIRPEFGSGVTVRHSGGAFGIEYEECRNYHVLFSKCSFDNCTSFIYSGGAIHIETSKTVQILDCTFDKSITQDNVGESDTNGAVIFIKYFGKDNPFIMSNVTISNGRTVGHCAGVYFQTQYPCPFLMKDVHFNNIYSTQSTKDNKAMIRVDDDVSYFEFVNSSIDYSQVTNQKSSRHIILSNLHYHIENCKFIKCGNDDFLNGMAISARNGNKDAIDCTIKSCTFVDCGRENNAIYSENRILNFINNSVTGDSLSNKRSRGLMIAKSCSLVVENSNFSFCGKQNLDFGGGLYYENDNQEERIAITGCIFENCLAQNSGAIRLSMYSTIPIFSNNSIIDFKTPYIISFAYSSENIIYESFKIEKINFIRCSSSETDCGGSGIWINNARSEGNIYTLYVEFIDCNFINDSSIHTGGAFGLGNRDSVKPTDLTFIRCYFVGNSCHNADTNGGGALWIRTSANCLIQNCTFKDNWSWESQRSDGGAIYLSFSSDLFLMNISDTIFTNNSCLNSQSLGHAIYTPILYGRILINRCNFTDNGYDCQTPNSIIYTLSELLIEKSNFCFTDKDYSYSRAFYVGTSSPFTLYNSFVSNFSFPNDKGGSIYYDSHYDRTNDLMEIINDTFINNSAAKGAEFYFSIHVEPTIKNCTFSNKFINSDLIIFDFFLEIDMSQFPVIFDNLHFYDCSFNGKKVFSAFSKGDQQTMSEFQLLDCEFISNENFIFASLMNIMLTINNTIFQDNIFNNYIFLINSENETVITNSIFRNNRYLPTDGFTNDDTASFIINQSAEFCISNTIFEHENYQEDENGALHGFILKANANFITSNVTFIDCSTIKYAIYVYSNEVEEEEAIQSESSEVVFKEMPNSNNKSGEYVDTTPSETEDTEEINETISTIFSLVNCTVDSSGSVFIMKKIHQVIVVNSTIKNTVNGLFYYPRYEAFLKQKEFIQIENCFFDSMTNCSCSINALDDLQIRNNTVKNCKNDKEKETPNFHVMIQKETKKELNIEKFTFESNEIKNDNNKNKMNGGGIGLVVELPNQRGKKEDIFINFIECRFISNKATLYGGAFAFYKYEPLQEMRIIIKFSRCNFVGNSCDTEKGGALYLECDSVEIENCIFESDMKDDNSAEAPLIPNEDKSAVFIEGVSSNDLMITECTFDRRQGMSICISNCSSNITFSECTFSSNKASTESTSIIQINTEKDINFVNSIFNDNQGYIINITSQENINFDNCTFDSNKGIVISNKDNEADNTGEIGKQVYDYYCINLKSEANFTLNHCSFVCIQKGAIKLDINGNSYIEKCIFDNRNQDYKEHSLLTDEITTIKVINCGNEFSIVNAELYDIGRTVISDEGIIKTIIIKDIYINTNTEKVKGPDFMIICSYENKITIENLTNHGSGGIYIKNESPTEGTLEINNINIKESKYGLYYTTNNIESNNNNNNNNNNDNDNENNEIKFENITFTQVQHAIHLKINQNNLTFYNLMIKECNNALYDDSNTNSLKDSNTKGIVHIEFSDKSNNNVIKFSNDQFIHNEYSTNIESKTIEGGGGIGLLISKEETTSNDSKETNISIEFEGCIFEDNQVRGEYKSNGGSLFYSDFNKETLITIKSIIIDNCEFIKNTAEGEGGSIYIETSKEIETFIITLCNFYSNTAKSKYGNIYINFETDIFMNIVISEDNIELNAAHDTNGGLCIISTNEIHITDTNFTNNAILSTSSKDENEDSENIGSCALSIITYCNHSSISLENVIIANNKASNCCSAFYCNMNDETSAILLSKCVFSNNFAKCKFGTIFLNINSSYSANVSVANCTIENNIAQGDYSTLFLNTTNENSILLIADCVLDITQSNENLDAFYINSLCEVQLCSCSFTSSQNFENNVESILGGNYYCIFTNNCNNFSLTDCVFKNFQEGAIKLDVKGDTQIKRNTFDNSNQEGNQNSIMNNEISLIKVENNEGDFLFENNELYDIGRTVISDEGIIKTIIIKDIYINTNTEKVKGPDFMIICSYENKITIENLTNHGSGGIYIKNESPTEGTLEINNINIKESKYGLYYTTTTNIESNNNNNNENENDNEIKFENIAFTQVQHAIHLKINQNDLTFYNLAIEECSNTLFDGETVNANDYSNMIMNTEGIVHIEFSDKSSNNYIKFSNDQFINNEYSTNIESKTIEGGGGIGLLISKEETTSNDSKETNISIEFEGCIFEDNQVRGEYKSNGGSLFYSDFNKETLITIKSIIIDNCEFIKNTAEGEGGSIYIETSKEIETFIITLCNFYSNTAKSKYGNIYINFETDISTNIVISEDNIELNTAHDTNGGLYIKGDGEIHIMDTNFINNKVIQTTKAEDASVDGSGAFSIISYNKNTSIWITFLIFNNNSFSNCGAVYINADKSSYSTIVIENCLIDKSLSNYNYGSFHIITNGEILVDRCTFNNNIAQSGHCGALCLDSSSNCREITVNNCFFDNNQAGSNCGALMLNTNKELSSIILIKCTFTNNIAGSKCGAISIESSQSNDLSISFTDNIIKNNVAKGEYGAISIKCSGTVSIESCELQNNEAGTNCGALFIDENGSSSVNISNLSINQNKAKDNCGAIFIRINDETSSASITNSDIIMNKAGKDFGAIYVSSKGEFSIDSLVLINNSASAKSSNAPEPTDCLYIEGCGNSFIRNTSFIRGSLINEKTNYQIAFVNNYKGSGVQNTFLIENCMLSIINPTTNQLFINNENGQGIVKIENSSFSHFFTLEQNIDDDGNLHFLDENKFNHIYVTDSCIGEINIIDTCFDVNEYIFTLDQKVSSRMTKISSDLSLYFTNNQIQLECVYPEVVDSLIQTIGEKLVKTPTQVPTEETLIDAKTKKSKIGLIVGLVVGFVCIATIAVIVAIYIMKKRKHKSIAPNINYEVNAEELCQETIDSLNTKYDKVWNIAPKTNVSNNQYFSQDKVETNQDDSSSSCDNIFEESKWN